MTVWRSDGLLRHPDGTEWPAPGRRPAGRLAGQGGGDGVAPDRVVVGERGGQRGRAVAVEEAGVGGSGHELRVAQGAHQQVAVGGDPVDPRPRPGRGQGGGGLGPGGGVGDDLGQHGVVVGADLAPGLDPLSTRTPARSVVDGERGGASRSTAASLRPGPRRRGGPRWHGRRAPGHRLVHLGGQRRTAGDEQLEPDQVEAGDRLGHRVLDLEPGVHLEEVRDRRPCPSVSRTNSTVPALT